MSTVEAVLQRHRSEILRLWIDRNRGATFAKGLTAQELGSIIPAYLDSLTAGGDGPLSEAQLRLLERHLATRLRQGASLNEIVTEFAMLERTILGFVAGIPDAEITRVHDRLATTTAAVTRIFSEHLLEDEQPTKRHLRRLQRLAGTTRVQRAVEIVMHALDADTATLMIVAPRTQRLEVVAAAGIAHEEVARYTAELDSSSFAGHIAGDEWDVTTVADAETTELDVSEALRHSGIHALLGVRLAAQRALRGVLWVGVRAHRTFTPSDVRLLERLAEALVMHVDQAALDSALRTRMDAVTVERNQMDDIVSMLVHDLSGPLTSARAHAQHLLAGDHADRSLASAQLGRDLEHLGAMIGELQQVHDVRAGRLPALVITHCDLSEVALDAVVELRATYGTRVVLAADRHVRGMWSAPQLRRVIWNLAVNGLEHGDLDAPVAIAIRRGAGVAEVAVHNDGPAIPPGAQAQLFEPFALPRPSGAHPPRWGVGLTLAWACAEAHGGRVEVESAAGKGTTFTLRIPYDARPYGDRRGEIPPGSPS